MYTDMHAYTHTHIQTHACQDDRLVYYCKKAKVLMVMGELAEGVCVCVCTCVFVLLSLSFVQVHVCECVLLVVCDVSMCVYACMHECMNVSM